MKPQTAAFLAESREFLDKAHDLFGAHHWPDEAGPAAYLAGLHAAQKTFDGTRRICPAGKGRPALRRGIPGVSPAHLQPQGHRRLSDRPRLARTVEQAQEAIKTAERFVDVITSLLA